MDFPFVKEAISQLFSKPSCAMYPAVPSEAAPRYRGRIAYHADKCIGCGMCERVCSGGAITRTVEKFEEGDKITLTFDLGSCTFCATCADFCSTKAIEFTQDYHMIATKEGDLLVTGTHIRPARKPAAPKPAPAAQGETAAAATAVPAVTPRDDGKPVCDETKCVHCTLCARKCPQGALEVDRAAKTWKCSYDDCVGCGACAAACPKKAIVM